MTYFSNINNSILQNQTDILSDMQRMSQLSGGTIAPATQGLFTDNNANQVSFASLFGQAIDHVNSLQNEANRKQDDYEKGLTDDLAGTMIATQKASIAFSAMVNIRNQLSSALNETINIPL